MAFFGLERSRHRRERRFFGGYPPAQYHDGYAAFEREYEDLRFDRVSITRHRRRRTDCYVEWCPFCKGDLQEPYEFLRYYDPLAEIMKEVHECCVAMEAGRFIAQDVADKFEEASRMINRMFGCEPVYRQCSVFLKNMAREVQLLPDNCLYPRYMRSRRFCPCA